MRWYLTWAAAVAAGPCAAGASAENDMVERSLEISVAPDRARDMIGDSCDADDWHPAVTLRRLKVIDDGLHGVVTLQDGAEPVEKRIAEEPGLAHTYALVNSPFPVDRCTATSAITRGDPSTVTWTARFRSDEPAMEEAVGALLEAGMSAIEARLAKWAVRRRGRGGWIRAGCAFRRAGP